MKLQYFIFDCEIKKCIPSEDTQQYLLDSDLMFCKGWDDFEDMRISLISCYSSIFDLYYFVTEHFEFYKFMHEYIYSDLIVGFNVLNFDIPLIEETFKIKLEKNKIFDIYDYITSILKIDKQEGHKLGFSLSKICEATLRLKKDTNGALAPILYQRNEIIPLCNYALRDIQLTKKLYDFIVKYNYIIHPITKEKILL